MNILLIISKQLNIESFIEKRKTISNTSNLTALTFWPDAENILKDIGVKKITSLELLDDEDHHNLVNQINNIYRNMWQYLFHDIKDPEID